MSEEMETRFVVVEHPRDLYPLDATEEGEYVVSLYWMLGGCWEITFIALQRRPLDEDTDEILFGAPSRKIVFNEETREGFPMRVLRSMPIPEQRRPVVPLMDGPLRPGEFIRPDPRGGPGAMVDR